MYFELTIIYGVSTPLITLFCDAIALYSFSDMELYIIGYDVAVFSFFHGIHCITLGIFLKVQSFMSSEDTPPRTSKALVVVLLLYDV